MQNVVFLSFPNVELMDLTGPYEVFSTFNKLNINRYLTIKTVGESSDEFKSSNGLTLRPDATLDESGKVDLLVIPGGKGARENLNNSKLLSWIGQKSDESRHVLTVCTGSVLAAAAGILDGLSATTHSSSFDLLSELAPHTKIVKNTRFVDNGKIVTSAGISAGIDASLHLIEVMYGKKYATETAHYMEYPYFK